MQLGAFLKEYWWILWNVNLNLFENILQISVLISSSVTRDGSTLTLSCLCWQAPLLYSPVTQPSAPTMAEIPLFVWLRAQLSENPRTSLGATAASFTLGMKSVSGLTQTVGVKFTRRLENNQPHLTIVSLLPLHNRANRLNPPWNALSRTCQHARVRSVLRSILIQPIEHWQLSVSQTFTRSLSLQVLSSSIHCWRSRTVVRMLKHTCWVCCSTTSKILGGEEEERIHTLCKH